MSKMEEEQQGASSDHDSAPSGSYSKVSAVGEIIEGKRTKKTVERLDFQAPKQMQKLQIGDGSGEKLGVIPRTGYQITKMKPADLKPLHVILFDRPGKITTIKKNLRLFNGFPFLADSDQYNKKRDKLLKSSHFTNSKLKVVCTVLDLEKKGTHSDLVDRILNFLVAPKSSGKRLPVKKKRKSKKKLSGEDSASKNKTKKSSNKKKPKSSSPKKTVSKSKAIVMDSSSDDDEEDEEEAEAEKPSEKEEEVSEQEEESGDSQDEEPEDKEEEEAPSSSKKRQRAPAKKASPKKRPRKKVSSDESQSDSEEEEESGGSQDEEQEEHDEEEEEAPSSSKKRQRAPAKKAPPRKRPRKKVTSGESQVDSEEEEEDEQQPKKKKKTTSSKPAAKTQKADSSSSKTANTAANDDSSDDDEPLIKMVRKAGPSEEQLRETVQRLLKNASLEDMTMKQICQRVFDTFPEHDLSSRKDFIKQTVKSLLT